MSPCPRLAPLACVRLLSKDAQPVSPAQPMHLSIVAGCVDGDQKGGLVLLPAPGTDDFQGVRYSANSVPRRRTHLGLPGASRGWCPTLGFTVDWRRNSLSLPVSYNQDTKTIHELGGPEDLRRCATCASPRWESVDRAWAASRPE
jgi:hypothetical protein